jgi:predicted nucleic acid-binding protein
LILDTNALSALADGDSAIRKIVSRALVIALPAVVLGEYLFGIRQSRARTRYEFWLAQMASRSDLLAVDDNTAGHYADIRTALKAGGRPIPSNDLWIAALAVEHRLPILSRDRHFDLIPGITRHSW